jgi:hypothetical protein
MKAMPWGREIMVSEIAYIIKGVTYSVQVTKNDCNCKIPNFFGEFGSSGYLALYRYAASENVIYILTVRHQREEQ